MLADQFTRVFREEHRKVRDLLLDLIRAFQNRDKASVRLLLHEIVNCTGPHFRYEEESLYPALVGILGEEYILKLFDDHDRAIRAAQRLIELSEKETFTDEGIAEAFRLIRTILPHVSDCDGLSIMVEALPPQIVQHILDTRIAALGTGLDLLRWVTTVRGRLAHSV